MENSENKIRQRAEELAKKTEAKIQKANEKEREYQEKKVENFNGWNNNFKNKNSNQRDYDKEPLIIQNCEEFFICTLLIGSLLFSGIVFNFLRELHSGTVLMNEYVKYTLISLGYIFMVYLFHIFHFSKNQIKLTNESIIFLDNNKLKRQCLIAKDELTRPFFTNSNKPNQWSLSSILCIFFTVATIVISIVGQAWFVLTFVPLVYLFNILIKIFFYVLLNKNLKGFKIFPFIRVANAMSDEYYGGAPTKRYYLIYLYNDEIYREVKEYFLQKNINIDTITKIYSI